MKKLITLACASVLAMTAGEAVANGTSKRPKAAKKCATTVKISGQVNRAALWADNGNASNWMHVDATDNAASMVRFLGTGRLNSDFMVKAHIAANIRSNASEVVDVHSVNNANTTQYNTVDPRRAINSNLMQARAVEAVLASRKFGTLTFGHGQMATSGVMRNTDFSGTEVVSHGAAVEQMAGGVRFFNSAIASKALLNTTGSAAARVGTDLTVARAFDSHDGAAGIFGRADRVRYDTPSFYGVVFSFSHAYRQKNDVYDVAGKWAGKFGGTKVAFQAGYVRNRGHQEAFSTLTAGSQQLTDAKFHQFNGSLGVLLDCGINFMVAASHRNWSLKGANDARVYFGKVGYKDKFFRAGDTAFAVDYTRNQGTVLDNGRAITDAGGDAGQPVGALLRGKYKGTSYGATLVQNFDCVGTQIYLAARRYALDAPKGDSQSANTLNLQKLKDVTVVLAGTRIKF